MCGVKNVFTETCTGFGTKARTKASTKASTEADTEASNKAGTKEVTEADTLVEAITEADTKAGTKASTKDCTKAITEPVLRLESKAVPRPVPELHCKIKSVGTGKSPMDRKANPAGMHGAIGF